MTSEPERHGAPSPSRAPGLRRGRVLGPVVTILACLGMLWLTWLRWAHPFVDAGREIYVAWRLSEGNALVADVAYLNGPLSPHVNAAWFSVVGPSYRALVLLNALVAAVIVRLVHRLLSSICGRLATTAACVVFVTIFVFGDIVGEGNYNYLFPYSHEMTHGLLLGLLALRGIQRLLRHPRDRDALLVGVTVGLAFLTKPEVLLAVGAAAAVGGALALAGAPASVSRGRLAALAVAGSLLPPILAYLLLLGGSGHDVALRATLGPYPAVLGSNVASSYYYRKGMGLDRGMGALWGVLRVGSYWAMALLAVALLGAAGRARVLRPLAALAAVGGAAAVYRLLFQDWWFTLGLPLQLAAALLLLWESRRYARATGAARRAAALHVTWLVFALALLVKMILFVRLWHYGFVLAAPAATLAVVALLERIPTALGRHVHAPTFRLAALVLLGLVVAAHVRLVADRLGDRGPLIGEGADAFRAGHGAGAHMVAALDEIQRRTRPEDRVLVVPEGVMLNYLTRRLTPMRHLNFMPPEIEIFGEASMVAELAAHPADLVVVIHKDTSRPYGVAFFGKDYGQQLWAAIERDYEEELVIGAHPGQGSEFGIALLRPRRRPSP